LLRATPRRTVFGELAALVILPKGAACQATQDSATNLRMIQSVLNYAPVIAVIISLLALSTSCVSLGWNIYRDVVMKPKLRVEFGVKNIIDGSGVSKPQY
jgi:hypothetical protein